MAKFEKSGANLLNEWKWDDRFVLKEQGSFVKLGEYV